MISDSIEEDQLYRLITLPSLEPYQRVYTKRSAVLLSFSKDIKISYGLTSTGPNRISHSFQHTATPRRFFQKSTLNANDIPLAIFKLHFRFGALVESA